MRRVRITVAICTHLGDERIGAALDSLASQTLAPSEFEILVVQNGPPCRTPEVVDAWARRHPHLLVRLLECVRPGAGHARNVALGAARGEFVTHLDDDDVVTSTYLEALLEASGPGLVAVAPIGDVERRADGTVGEADYDNYQARAVIPRLGRILDVGGALAPFGMNAGKLIETARARLRAYDEELRSGEDFVYWAQQYALEPFRWSLVSPGSGGAYLRVVRPGSLSRQSDGYDFGVTQRLDCLQRLQEIAPGDHRLDRVISYLSEGQASHINRFLLNHPDRHGDVLSDARARGLSERMPWSFVNDALPRTLAVLYAFPPFVDTSGLVAAKRLSVWAEPFDVVCQDMSNIRGADPGALRIAREFQGHRRLVPGDAASHWWAEVRRFTEHTLEAVREHDERHDPYLRLYSRAMSVQSHIAAAVVRARNPQIRWTAEFSDPLLKDSDGADREPVMRGDWLSEELRGVMAGAGFEELPEVVRFYEVAELVAYALADEIIFTNDHQRDFMLGYCRDPALAARARAVSRVEHHPVLSPRHYEMAQSSYSLADGVVNIGYFGVFYATRGLDDVVAAVGRLRLEERAKVRLHVFTRDPVELAVDSIRQGVADVVVARPYEPFLEFLNLSTRFQVLLVNDATTKEHHPVNPYLPSKLADYVGSGAEIWSVIEPGSVLAQQQTAYSSQIGDVPGTLAQLRRMIERHVGAGAAAGAGGLQGAVGPAAPATSVGGGGRDV